MSEMWSSRKFILAERRGGSGSGSGVGGVISGVGGMISGVDGGEGEGARAGEGTRAGEGARAGVGARAEELSTSLLFPNRCIGWRDAVAVTSVSIPGLVGVSTPRPMGML